MKDTNVVSQSVNSLVELLPDGGLVPGSEACPGLVRRPVVLITLNHLQVVAELQDFPPP